MGPSLGFSLVAEGRGCFLVRAVHRLLAAAASLIAERGLSGVRASIVAVCGLSGCRFQALEHRLHGCGASS